MAGTEIVEIEIHELEEEAKSIEERKNISLNTLRHLEKQVALKGGEDYLEPDDWHKQRLSIHNLYDFTGNWP